jgi:hypothetical protein
MKIYLGPALLLATVTSLSLYEPANAQGCRFLLDSCDPRGTPRQAPSPRAPTPNRESMESLVECCLAYCPQGQDCERTQSDHDIYPGVTARDREQKSTPLRRLPMPLQGTVQCRDVGNQIKGQRDATIISIAGSRTKRIIRNTQASFPVPLPVLSTAHGKCQRELHQIARLPDLKSA